MSLISASIPPISKEFFDILRTAHQPVRAQPGITTLDELMYDAGKQDLIEWIAAHGLKDQIITGGPQPDVSRTVTLR